MNISNGSSRLVGSSFWQNVKGFFAQLLDRGLESCTHSLSADPVHPSRPSQLQPKLRPETPVQPLKDTPFKNSPAENLQVDNARMDHRI